MTKCIGAVIVALLAPLSHAMFAQEPQIARDTRMHVLHFEDLSYPLAAKAARVQGVVVVRATLDAGGNVKSAIALSGGPPLAQAAVDNAKKWRFTPAAQDSVILVFEFRFDGNCADDSHSLFRQIHWNFASITACSPAFANY